MPQSSSLVAHHNPSPSPFTRPNCGVRDDLSSLTYHSTHKGRNARTQAGKRSYYRRGDQGRGRCRDGEEGAVWRHMGTRAHASSSIKMRASWSWSWWSCAIFKATPGFHPFVLPEAKVVFTISLSAPIPSSLHPRHYPLAFVLRRPEFILVFDISNTFRQLPSPTCLSPLPSPTYPLTLPLQIPLYVVR